MVNYAPGSAGKFLTSLLMSSASLAHFDPVVESNKTADACINYIQQRFSKNLSSWIKFEPNHGTAWNLHFVSGKYPRGDDLTIDQFIKLATDSATDHFCHSVNQDKIIPSVWHKVNVPDFLSNSMFVTIIIDPLSIKWYHRAVWFKLYDFINGRIYIKNNDPKLNPAMAQYCQKFNNPIYSDDKFFTFVKRDIINDSFKKTFLSQENFVPCHRREFILLSDLLNYQKCQTIVNQICNRFNIDLVPPEVVLHGHQHWLSCHDFKYSTTN